ncbi:hypothetical protein [Candidatus Methanoperedens nitratireducens]|uniref:Uncharacterized protein n=1 Tax=Candidatus Methanoperedens nitratireducens TaxID=1392998 RepID=A0A284VIB5_9EURY|nr:hypothetical protein [Candidatus Methanoperedens nitroreducens]SNQ59005.1 exported hypothetical protein [Candidatus Methanoperedens nitroreducens]
MKKLNKYVIFIFLVLSLISTTYGFAGMGANKSTVQTDLNNSTQSDQDIQLLQHLIEIDTIQFESQNKLYVRETLIYKNTGTANFSGTLRTWMPDDAENISVERAEMMANIVPVPLNIIQNGNIISWQDFIEMNSSLPPLYIVEYVLPANSLNKLSKKLLYPTLISKVSGSLILKITKDKGNSVTITDENGNDIGASGNPKEEDNSVLYGWVAPGFMEINIRISKPAATPAGIAGYVIIGLLILLALSYPVLRKRSERLQAIEGKIRTSFERKPEETTEEPEEAVEETPETSTESGEAEAKTDEVKFAGKTGDELENEKNELISMLDKVEKDYASGNLIDEEYEELSSSLRTKIERINKRIEKPD